MNAVQVVHQEDLGVSFTTITGSRAFTRLADFDDNDIAANKVVSANYPKIEECHQTHGTTCPSNSYNPEYTLP